MSDSELPKAVASGRAASTPDAVKPLRYAIGAGVVAALYLLAIYLANPVPAKLRALFGGAQDELEQRGGVELRWIPPGGMSIMEVESRFRAAGTEASVRGRDGDALLLAVPGVARDDMEEVARRIGSGEGLSFRRVLNDTPEMKQLIRVLQLPMKGQEPVDADVDQWRSDRGSETQTDYYLFGATCQMVYDKLVEATQQGWAPPSGAFVAYELVDWGEKPGCRSYVIDERIELDGSNVASAVKSYDPNTNRPIVLLDFDRQGAEKFGQLTAEIVGKKLAIMVGDEVRSAPVINDPIRGGRASITMGGSDARVQEHEAELLVATLRLGALPKGGQIVAKRYVAPVNDRPMQWLARSALSLAGGALIALLVWIVIRVTRPVRRAAPAATAPGWPWSRVLVTLTAPIAVYVVGQITIWGIDQDELLYRFGGNSFGALFDQGRDPFESLRIGALGIMPIINACILVEVLSLIVPSWRRSRHRGPQARVAITIAAVATAITLVVLQGWFITNYLLALGDVMTSRVLVIGSFALGTAILTAVALLIREHGLGNGFGALVASGWLVQVATWWLDGPAVDADVVVFAMTVIAIAVPLGVVMRWRIARLAEAPLRLPTSGLMPVAEAGGLVALYVIVSQFQIDELTMKLSDWTFTAREQRWVVLALLALLTLMWSFLFARPSREKQLAERVGLVAPARSTWWTATGLSLALLMLVGVVSMITNAVRPSAAIDAVSVAIVTVVLLDIFDDFRARRVSLERVWTLHQPQFADLVTRALNDAAIPHHLTATHLRTLLAFFGPFAPIDVLVPPEHAPAAREKLTKLFE